MGLGKSCSMTALIANDSKDSRRAIHIMDWVLFAPYIQHYWSFLSLSGRTSSGIRHRASKRVQDVTQLHGCNVVITTYQTVEYEWRRSVGTMTPFLFSVQWRRIILDEAHYVRDRSTNTSKAICFLQADSRSAVTGIPLQNRLGDLAIMFQCLRVFPYYDPKRFECDIIQVWKTGLSGVAVDRLKRLLLCILLRRAKGNVELPLRVDTVLTLQFNNEEFAHYTAIEGRVVNAIDAALTNGKVVSQGTYLSVLQQINELWLICNLGIHRRKASLNRLPKSQLGTGDSFAAQKALDALVTAGYLLCSRCSLNQDAIEVEDTLSTELSGNAPSVQLHQCLRMICSSCVQRHVRLSCGHQSPCPRAPVFPFFSKLSPSASSPSNADRVGRH
ncbi:hypothetical protein K469DRAFT_675844 [Zopfia rhizophila CBS 207.26]|uniref:Helicase ATP-binding domain-containing protein n=1 Tax=Zopfia rhizophila CBS 207.26 TaxID=1314779 RepID=A0A6A6DJ07_9PEZI|nr:hypothetical protein K469DRAFT_675844 [Zopfia rhizophila CBS 207.26]